MINSPFMQSSFSGSLGPSIATATNTDDEKLRQLRAGSMMLPDAYHSKPVAVLPPAQPFHPGAAFGGPAPAQAAAMKDGGDAMWKGLTQAAQNVGKGIQSYQANQNRQGILGDPLGVGANGQLPMPDANGFVPPPDPNAIDPAVFANQFDPNWFSALGGFW